MPDRTDVTPPSLLFSYSHKDESLRDQLEVHLSALKRQSLISTWHDRRITEGSEFGKTIDAHVESDEIILLLVSPDFIASDFCYDREMARAMERHRKGEARVIPVILRPCDWHDLPFGKLLAAPRDGKPITTWPNIDEAFQDVVRAIKSALQELAPQRSHLALAMAATASALGGASSSDEPVRGKPEWEGAAAALGGRSEHRSRSSNLRTRKQFTDYDLDQFRQQGFDFIAKYFQNSLDELVARNTDLRQIFRREDANHFSAAVYQAGKKVCMGSAALSTGGMMGTNAITYAMTDDAQFGGINEAVYAEADDQKIFFKTLGMQSFGNRDDKEKLSREGAAEFFWELFLRPLQ